MPRTESPAVLSKFAVRSHKEKACFPFRVSLKSVGPLSGASTQTAVMEQMPLNGSPVRTSGLRQSRLSFSCSFPKALQPLNLFPVICQWQTSGRLREAAGGPKRRSTFFFRFVTVWTPGSTRASSNKGGGCGLLWPDFIGWIRASCLHSVTLYVSQPLIEFDSQKSPHLAQTQQQTRLQCYRKYRSWGVGGGYCVFRWSHALPTI